MRAGDATSNFALLSSVATLTLPSLRENAAPAISGVSLSLGRERGCAAFAIVIRKHCVATDGSVLRMLMCHSAACRPAAAMQVLGQPGLVRPRGSVPAVARRGRYAEAVRARKAPLFTITHSRPLLRAARRLYSDFQPVLHTAAPILFSRRVCAQLPSPPQPSSFRHPPGIPVRRSWAEQKKAAQRAAASAGGNPHAEACGWPRYPSTHPPVYPSTHQPVYLPRILPQRHHTDRHSVRRPAAASGSLWSSLVAPVQVDPA